MLPVREDKLVQLKVLRAPVWHCVLPSLSECVMFIWGHISDQPGQISSLLHTCLLPGSCLALVMFLIWKCCETCCSICSAGLFVAFAAPKRQQYDMIPIKRGAFSIQFAVTLNLNAIFEDHLGRKWMDNANLEQMLLWFLIYLKHLK